MELDIFAFKYYDALKSDYSYDRYKSCIKMQYKSEILYLVIP
jgi:hypothetical protein